MKFLALACFGLMIIACQPQSDAPCSKYKTMMIRAQGEVETLPDEASFQLSLNCLDKSIKRSKQCLVDKSNELTDRLKELGIDGEDILTTAVNLNKSYTWSRNSRIFEGYRSTTTMYVTVKNLDKLDEIYTELLENRNLELGGLSYTHTKMDSLQNEAYLKALQNAQGLADKLLGGLPEKESEVLKIGNVEISSSVPQPERPSDEMEVMQETKMAVRKQSVAINKGTVLVNATLYVEFQID